MCGITFSTGLAKKRPFINPSIFWTILASDPSYPHADSLDVIDDRGCDLHRTGADFGRCRQVGLDRRLTKHYDSRPPDGLFMTLGRPLVSPISAGFMCRPMAQRRASERRPVPSYLSRSVLI